MRHHMLIFPLSTKVRRRSIHSVSKQRCNLRYRKIEPLGKPGGWGVDKVQHGLNYDDHDTTLIFPLYNVVSKGKTHLTTGDTGVVYQRTK